jgi:hypothetical protein
MEKFGNNCGGRELVDGSDVEANEKINREIADLRAQGYRVLVGENNDPAYKNPEKIEKVYSYLERGGRELREVRNMFIRSNMGRAAVAGVVSKIPFISKLAGSWNKELDDFLEPYRDELLYGEEETNSQPWHKQRGSASTFLSIGPAFSLAVIEGGKLAFPGRYPTMSGPIDESLFDEKIDGVPLRDMMIEAEVANHDKTQQEAVRAVDERINNVREFINAPVTPKFAEIIKYCADGIGIRERKDIVNRHMIEHLKKTAERDEDRSIDDMLVMSFGCGTGLPTLQMLKELKEKTGQAPTAILIDQDPLALAAAQNLAKKMGLENNVEIHCHRLFSKFGRPLGLKKVLKGRQVDVMEDSGLREYLPDMVHKKLTEESWGFLRDGGLMITGNMNANRPQKDFPHGLMGWTPNVIMRPIARSLKLLQAAGVSKDNITANITASGVYSVFAVEKPDKML